MRFRRDLSRGVARAGWLLPRVAVGLMAVWAMVISARIILSETSHAAVEDIAVRLKGGLVTEPGFWAALDLSGVREDWTIYPCGGTAMQASFVVDLAEIDSLAGAGLNGPAAFAAHDRAVARAVARGEALVGCAPLDASTWLRLARLSVEVDGLGPKTIGAFDMADRLAPSEGWLIGLRLPIYAEFAREGLPGFQARATRDVELYTAFGHDPSLIIQWLQAWPTVLRDGVIAGLTSVPLRERRWFNALAKEAGIDIGQGDKGTIIIDPFTGKPFNGNLD